MIAAILTILAQLLERLNPTRRLRGEFLDWYEGALKRKIEREKPSAEKDGTDVSPKI